MKTTTPESLRESQVQQTPRPAMHSRRLPIGAEVLPEGDVHFRVWAPRARSVAVCFEDPAGSVRQTFTLQPETDGYFSGAYPTVQAGCLYRYRLDGKEPLLPDPASRFQPDGPHGPSQVIDPDAFAWTDAAWRGVALPGQIIYEMHIGTFTPEGTWKSALARLPQLVDTGITVLEVMPVADFPGRFGWGYDGVNLFAPTRLYGSPDDFRLFVNEAHRLGLAVILDVVYNHLGPDGNYLKHFSPDYVTDRYKNEWGEAINFDGPSAGPVREFFVVNAGYWIEEYHLDGLRLDATQQIFDGSPRHVLAEITERVRSAARGRSTLLVAENEPQHVRLVQPLDEGGYGMDALWNDDYHHSAKVALTGHNQAYYTDYRGMPQEFISAIKWGYLYQGQWYTWQKQRRGTPTFGIPPAAFVVFLENHDQIANSGCGPRCGQLAAPGVYRALTALTLLAPGTPMLFQGQEFAASAPFLYFVDHKPDLAPLVAKGRKEFLSQFPSLALPETQRLLAEPHHPATFERCKLDWSERERHAEALALHHDLLKLRREDPAFRAQQPRGVDGAVLGERVFVLRFFGEQGDDRLLVVNLGYDLHLNPAPEPLLAPPLGRRWRTLWSSDDPAYGGYGTPALDTEENWRVPGQATVVLAPVMSPSPAREEGKE